MRERLIPALPVGGRPSKLEIPGQARIVSVEEWTGPALTTYNARLPCCSSEMMVVRKAAQVGY